MRTILLFVACFIWAGSPLLAAEASEGKEVFQKMCSRCHKLPESGTRTAEQWKLVIDIMQGIMQQRGETLLNEKEKQQVLLYLQENAKQPSSARETGAENLFIARCALCHQLPEPGMLKAAQWKLIIKTMQQRMQQAGVPQLKEGETELIMEYLTEHARK